MSNYKNYSLDHLRDCIQDCVQSEARPHEIYETIRNTIADTIKFHEVCLRDSKDLLSLLSGSEAVSIQNMWDQIGDHRERKDPAIFARWQAEDTYNRMFKEKEKNK